MELIEKDQYQKTNPHPHSSLISMPQDASRGHQAAVYFFGVRVTESCGSMIKKIKHTD